MSSSPCPPPASIPTVSRWCAKFFDIDGDPAVLKTAPAELGGKTLGEALLAPTKIYVKPVLKVLEEVDVKGISHITGGGFYDNIPRILPEDCDAEVNAEAWEIPVVFKKLQEWGNVPWAEMYRTFNMGVGMVLVVAPSEADAVRAHLTEAGETFYELGKVVPGHKETIMKGGVFLVHKIGVLVSGRGSNLQAVMTVSLTDICRWKLRL